MKRSRYAYFFPIVFTGIWGLTFVWSQNVLQVYPPITMVFLRLSLASIVLFAFVKTSKKLQKIDQKDWRLLLIAVFCEPFLYFICESYGIIYSNASFASIMIALIPLITPIGMWLVFKTRSSLAIVAGLLISFGGVSYMALGDNLELMVDIRGILFLSMAVVTAVLYTLCIQKLVAKYNNFTIVYYQTTLGALMFLPLFLIFGLRDFATKPFCFNIYGNLLMLAVFGSSIAYICFVESIKQLGAVKTFLFSNLTPIVATIGAYFLLNETLSVRKTIGIGLVILGLFVSQIEKKTIR